MHYSVIKKRDVANGLGVRVSLFVSGCTRHCPGCFNRETWDFNYGTRFSSDTLEELLEALAPNEIRGLSILGGEPFEQMNQFGLLPIARAVKEAYPNKSIWCYTGYLFDQDILGTMASKWPETTELLSYIDVLVDGPFIESMKDLNLRFRGSSNQRIILVQESLKQGSLVLWDQQQDFIHP